jgi:hypothetical protein
MVKNILPAEGEHYTKDGKVHPTVEKRLPVKKEKKQRRTVATGHIAAAAEAQQENSDDEPTGQGGPNRRPVKPPKRARVN